jgi:hypothetical protein
MKANKVNAEEIVTSSTSNDHICCTKLVTFLRPTGWIQYTGSGWPIRRYCSNHWPYSLVLHEKNLRIYQLSAFDASIFDTIHDDSKHDHERHTWKRAINHLVWDEQMHVCLGTGASTAALWAAWWSATLCSEQLCCIRNNQVHQLLQISFNFNFGFTVRWCSCSPCMQSPGSTHTQ